MFLFWNHKVIVLYLYLHTEAAESSKSLTDTFLMRTPSPHTAMQCERTYLNHTRQNEMPPCSLSTPTMVSSCGDAA